jgi:hypothetical protein
VRAVMTRPLQQARLRLAQVDEPQATPAQAIVQGRRILRVGDGGLQGGAATADQQVRHLVRLRDHGVRAMSKDFGHQPRPSLACILVSALSGSGPPRCGRNPMARGRVAFCYLFGSLATGVAAPSY